MMSNPSSDRHQKRLLKFILFSIGLFIFLNGCSQATPVVVTVLVPEPSTQASQTAPAPQTTISNATSSPEVTVSPAVTSTTGASCTVQQDLNLRNGPGTAYNPPIAILKDGTRLVPIGFNSQGVPSGPWVQVQVEGTSQAGWVSAGAQFVSCNLELASLPVVTVPPPPKPAPPKVGTGVVDGNGIDYFRSSMEFDPEYFMRMYVFRTDDPDEQFSANKDGRDITSVQFTVTSLDGDVVYYDRTENTAGYCIFGGGEPDCSPWIYENGQYKWESGGDPVQPGNYQLTITVTAEDDQVGVWFWDSKNPISITLP
jgi:hypothetical protein